VDSLDSRDSEFRLYIWTIFYHIGMQITSTMEWVYQRSHAE